ncbi:MAG: hypothetical protein KGL39_48895 [Patescibacteria group bacterium]|nr:hypothetical protein [Patescibacteria group bacterium]
MANTFAPFGFSQVKGTGSSPTYEQVSMKIASNNTTAIFKGDAVVPVTGAATGYIAQATAGTVALAGVFVGCKYLSTSQKRTVWGNYWPGSDATGDVTAYVVNDPNAQFVVQANSSLNVPYSKVGQLAQLGVGTGNTTNGVSGMYLASIGTTATFPFRIVDVVTDPPGANGTDTASNGNYVVVAFNNVLTRSNGALTGIS